MTRKTLYILAAVIFLLVGGGLVYAKQKAARPIQFKNFVLEVEADNLASEQTTFTVRKGEHVKFVVNAKQQDEETGFIIKGYGQQTTFSQNSVGNLEFQADKAGTFDIRLRPEESLVTKTVAKLVVTDGDKNGK